PTGTRPRAPPTAGAAGRPRLRSETSAPSYESARSTIDGRRLADGTTKRSGGDRSAPGGRERRGHLEPERGQGEVLLERTQERLGVPPGQRMAGRLRAVGVDPADDGQRGLAAVELAGVRLPGGTRAALD